MPRPLISIVIPTWNRAKFIGKNLTALLNQDYENFEVIVVDDGSTDNTEEVVGKFNDSRISYFKKENEERAVARNFGRQKSSGDYINFFDSDDYAYPNHLSVAVRLIEANSSPEAFHLDYEFRDGEGSKLMDRKGHIENINRQLIDGNILSCNGVFIRKDIAEKHPFNEDRKLSASEDYLLWMQLAAQYKIIHENTVTSCIVDHDARSVINVNQDGLIERKTRMIQYLFEDPVAGPFYSKYKNKMTANAQSYIALHFTLAENIKNRNAIPFLKKALAANPGIIFQKRTWAIVKRLILS